MRKFQKNYLKALCKIQLFRKFCSVSLESDNCDFGGCGDGIHVLERGAGLEKLLDNVKNLAFRSTVS